MGWAGGSSLLDEVAKAVMKYVPEKDRPKVAGALIDAFEGEDCDTINECEQKDIRAEYDKRNPPEDD